MKRQNRIAFFNILSTLLLRGISIFTAPLFSRLLGTNNYGVSDICNTWVSVFAIVFTLQTQGTLVNARVEYPEDLQRKYQSSAMSMSVMLYALCAGLMLLFLPTVSEALKLDKILIVLMLVQAFGTFCVNFLHQKFVYEFKAGRNMVLSLGVTLLTLVLSLIFVLRLPKEINYLGRVGAVTATYALIGIPACVYILAKGRTFVSKQFWKFCIVLAIPSVFYNLSDLLLGVGDKLMLQQMLGEAQVGQYSLALKLGGVMFTIFAALNNTWCPFFFEEMKLGQREKMMAKSRNFLELYTVLSVGFILLATEVYHLYAAKSFWGSTMLIPLFVTNYYLNFLCTFPVNYEYYHKKTKVVAAVTIFSSLVNLGLNYVLIQNLGMTGAALATMSSHCLQLGIHYVYNRYILGRLDYPFGIRVWGKYALAYFAVVAFVYLSGDAWLIRWAIGAAIGVWELLRIRKRKVLI